MPASDLDYLTLQVEALFTYDAHGRIVATNEPSPQPGPRLFLGRTSVGNLWRVRSGLPNATADALATLADAEPIASDPRMPVHNVGAMLEVLGTDADHTVLEAGPAYRFPDVIVDTSALGATVRRLSRTDIPLLESMRAVGWDPDRLPDEFAGWEPMLALFIERAIVALAFSSRNTPRAAECGVDTLPALRGRGYAPTIVAAWAEAVRASGRIPLYSTSWENSASQAVARKLGLIPYGADFSLF